MKTHDIIIISSMVMLISMQSSCRSRMVNSERNKTKLEQKENVRLNTQQSELVTGNRVVHFTDSGSRLYRVEIFPLDTFTYSADEGFRGRASKINMAGTEMEVREVWDSLSFTAENERAVQYDGKNESREKGVIAKKEVESRGSDWFVGVLVVVGGIVCYVLFSRRRKGWMIF